jgi:hypothetical protein
VWRYLNGAQRTQWQQAEALITQGQSDIGSGNFNLGLTSDQPTGKGMKSQDVIEQQDLLRAHQEGQQEVAQGQAEIKQGQATLAQLRQAAQTAYANVAQIPPTIYSLEVPTQQWPDVAGQFGAEMMKTLQDQKYTRIYLGDVVAYKQSQYAPVPALADLLRQNLLTFDGNHYSFVPTYDWAFKIARDPDNNLVLDFPGRDQLLRFNKAALVVAEVIAEPQGGYAFVSLRAMDLADWRIVYDRLYVLSIDTSLGKVLGLAANQIASRREIPLPAGAAVASAPAPAAGPNAAGTAKAAKPAASAPAELSLKVVDTSNFVASLKEAGGNYVFRADSAGSDYDFLQQTLASDVSLDHTTNPMGVNAAWSVANLNDETPSTIDLDLYANEIAPNGAVRAAVKVGDFDIQRSFPTLTPPSAEELAAAGFDVTTPTNGANSSQTEVASPPSGTPVPSYEGGSSK